MTTDDNRAFVSSDKVSRTASLSNLNNGHILWQEVYVGTPVSDADKPAIVSLEKLAASLPNRCSPSPEYQKFIDLALSEAYEPQAFGDPKKIRHEFDCQINDLNDAVKYANQVLSRSGDSHTKVMPRAANRAMIAKADPKIIGLGIETTADARTSSEDNEHGVAIYRSYLDSPATKAGLKTGDVILSVDGQDVSKLSFQDADAKLSGEAGSVAHLLVERNGERLPIDVMRQEYHPPAVSDVSLPDNLAYISIQNFRNMHLPEQLRDALLRHKDAKGFVIDVRDNPGGDVDKANVALSEVMPDGQIMKIRERNLDDKDHVSYLSGSYELTPNGIFFSEKEENQQNSFQIGNTNQGINFGHDLDPITEVKARMKNLVGDRPVVLLIGPDTASAAEIFAGAEHDTGGARTVGTNSFGKGIGGLYTSSGLPGGAGEVITNMHYFTPSGFWPGDAEKHKYGLKADLEVSNRYGAIPTTASDLQLIAAENDLKNTLAKRNE